MRHPTAVGLLYTGGVMLAVGYLATVLVADVGPGQPFADAVSVTGTMGPHFVVALAVLLGWVAGGAVEQMWRAASRGKKPHEELAAATAARVWGAVPVFFVLVGLVALFEWFGAGHG